MNACPPPDCAQIEYVLGRNKSFSYNLNVITICDPLLRIYLKCICLRRIWKATRIVGSLMSSVLVANIVLLSIITHKKNEH